ncbi:MAG: 50S ribosomal protein L13 [Candidatus Omnitrophica bacterium]|nr:50S ribosomal protein L13 [Candidatus Omnitrophota bacterium]
MLHKENVHRTWHLIDGKDQVLGRLAGRIANLLIGKGKTCYTPNVDMGDGVIVINADKIIVTGRKLEQKFYKRFSGYPGGLKEEPMKHVMVRKPTYVLMHAVTGMIPKNRLGSRMLTRLRIYTGDKHQQAAQLAVPKPKTDDKKIRKNKETK